MLLKLLTILLPLTFHHVGIQSDEYPPHVGGRKPTVLFVGDSLCVGMKPAFERITRESGWVGVNSCRIGTTSLQWDEWIGDEIRRVNPKLVLISLGTNDGYIYGRIKASGGVYGRILNTASSQGAAVVWVEPPRISRKVIVGIEWVRGSLHREVPTRFESEVCIIPPPGDGIHLTGRGYDMWMERIWEWMSEEGILGYQEVW